VNTTAVIEFLRQAGVDMTPDPANIPDLKRAGWSNHDIADTYQVSVRTVQRYLRSKHRCPGYPLESCLTDVAGGGLCTFCRKTRAACWHSAAP